MVFGEKEIRMVWGRGSYVILWFFFSVLGVNELGGFWFGI